MTALFGRPWVLLALPLAVLPWLRGGAPMYPYPWLALLPRDPFADAVDAALKISGSVVIAACVMGLAGPYVMRQAQDRVGRGAQIVVLLDRSRSMDQPFAGGSTGNKSLVAENSTIESKGGAARRLLAEFAAHRQHDLLALVAFTTVPIRVTGFTARQAMIQAAIAAGNVGRGLADTDLGLGLLAALGFFEHQPYNGSRVVLLVSDGGAHLDAPTQQRLTELMKRERVALYWLYLRARHSPGLLSEQSVAAADQDIVPEHFLHQYFQTMGVPYHAYEAEDPDALQRAMNDVDRLQSLPIRFQYPARRRDLAGTAYGIAWVGALLLCAAAWSAGLPWR